MPRTHCIPRPNMLLAVLVGELLAASHPAFAQQAEPAKPPAQDKPVAVAGQGAPGDGAAIASVSVSAERPTNRIDRQVYDVKSDAASTNGSAADALANVPSVAVDPDGSVTLRGNTNVQIYIDGKPSAMLQGDNRGAALQAIPAGDIESVEVINNPGAQFGNETGGGPIINLVMRRERKPGGFGIVNANRGTAGRYNTSVSGTCNTGRFSFQGGANVRHDGRNSTGAVERERINPATGAVTKSAQASASSGMNDSAGFNGSVKYNLGDDDTLGANASYMARTNNLDALDRYLRFGAADAVSSDYLRSTRRGGESRNASWGAHWDHKGAAPGETFKLDARVSGSSNDSDSDYVNAYSVRPAGALDSHSTQRNDSATRIADLSGDYERPGDAGVFKLGFKAIDNDSSFDARYADIEPATGARVPNARRSNSFGLDQRNLAVYGSYQWRLTERLGVQGGLRSEYTHVDIDQVTAQVKAANRYVSYIPSAFATYKLTDDTNLRLAYSRRLRRASAGELNPFVVYRDELNESSGNPKLRPATTDSFELGLEGRLAGLQTNLRGYYRRNQGMIVYRRSFVNETVVLTTPENGAGSRAGGLEFTVSGKITPKFTINASGNLARVEQQQVDDNGAGVRRTASSLGMNGRVNYQLTEADSVQVALNAQGRTLTGQGFRQPNATTSLNLRHMLTPSLSLVMNVTDAFNQQKVETITDTGTLKEASLRRYDGRIVYVGLSWRLGGPAARERRGG